ncbi:MAG: radical SAM protein [Candidatus Aenigmatarchaeota archaeon]
MRKKLKDYYIAKKIKLYLIEPLTASSFSHTITLTPNPNSFGSRIPSGIWEPYALECLGSYIKKLYPFLNVEILQGDLTYIKTHLLKDFKLEKYETTLLGISLYTYMFNETLNFLEDVKNRRKIITIVGGYHASGDPEEISKYPQVDFVAKGEGEAPLSTLIEEIINGHLPSEKILPQQNISMSNFPYPLRIKKYLMRARMYPLAYPPPDKQISPAMITYGRGCQFKCPFCASSLIWPSSRISYRPVDHVIKEIKYLQQRFQTNLLYWTDLALNNEKEKAIELTSAIIESGLKINSFAYVNQELDEELCDLLKKAGFTRLGFGVETLNPENLTQIKNFQNLEKVKEALEIANEKGIITRAYLMIGFPDSEPKEIIETVYAALEFPIDQLRLGFLTPFIGTPFYEKYKDSITREWKRFTGDVPVFLHHIERENEWITTRDKALEKFYTDRSYIKRIKKKIKIFPYLRSSFRFFSRELRKVGIYQKIN